MLGGPSSSGQRATRGAVKPLTSTFFMLSLSLYDITAAGDRRQLNVSWSWGKSGHNCGARVCVRSIRGPTTGAALEAAGGRVASWVLRVSRGESLVLLPRMGPTAVLLRRRKSRPCQEGKRRRHTA